MVSKTSLLKVFIKIDLLYDLLCRKHESEVGFHM